MQNWSRDLKFMKTIFNNEETEIINEKIKNLKISTIVYCSFENRFAKSGGLGAVTKQILPYLNSFSNETNAILITPFYENIIKEKLKSTEIIFNLNFRSKKVKVEILENEINYYTPENNSYKEYYLKVDDFFYAQNILNDPYLYVENNPGKNNKVLNENALLFSLAVCHALKELKITKNIIFHLQEWQTACIALTSKEAMADGIIESACCIQTMHNPYDSFFKWMDLKKISKRINNSSISKINAFFKKELDGLTAYQLGLNLVDAPITTVSKNFAKELTEDLIQTKHFAPHLQKIFKKKSIYGIINGLFDSFPEEYKNYEKLTEEKIRKIKTEKRKELLQIIDNYQKDKSIGKLTYNDSSILNLPENIPIFVMSGRLDYNQKGYDFILEAILRFKKDELKVILTPLGTNNKDLDFFRKISEKTKGNLIIILGKMEKGFRELRMGSSFGVMPSIYEPFGAAVEYLVNGTVVIARKTGGLVDQINKKTGILFREKYNYKLQDLINFRISNGNIIERMKNKWVLDIIESLYKSVKKAIKFYQNQNLYYNMIINGFKKSKDFNWKNSAEEYFKIYKLVNKHDR